MFTHVSSVGKTRVFSLVLVLGLVMGALSLAGCDPDGDDEGELSGTWISAAGGDQFVIDKSANTFVYSAGNPSWGMDYSGTIVGAAATNKGLLSNTTGYLTLKITSSGAYATPVGQYFRIFWKDLTVSTVNEAGAYKLGGSTGENSISDAETEFTVANGYFDMVGAYTKQ
jgi:hypothetical protein